MSRHRPELGSRLQRVHLIPRRRAAASAAAVLGAPLQDGWGLWAALATAASLSQVVQTRTQAGKLLSAPLLAILFGLLLSATGLIPLECATYDTISSYLLPIAAALYLLESDLRELSTTAKSSVVAFVLATVGTLAGTVVAWLAVGRLLGPDGWKVAAALAASYIGGSVNFAAVSSALGMSSGPLLASAMSADMVAMAAYLALIGWWPVEAEDGSQAANKASAPISQTAGATVDSVGAAIAAAVLACAIGTGLAAVLGIPGFSLGLVAVVASCFASLGSASSQGMETFKGAEALGGALMSFFFVTIGAAAGSVTAIFGSGWLLAFIAVQLAVHLALTMGIGALMGLPTRALLTASNAAVGGPGTAAAMAASREWPALIRPALIIGAFGYSIGTALGVSVGHFIRFL